ncbi:MAG: PaaI family thioesterase, partial [Mycobacterium sp.]
MTNSQALNFSYEVMGADEHERLVARYGPLTDDIRTLIEAALRAEAEQDAIDTARTAIQAATVALR